MFKCIFLNQNISIVIEIALKFIPKDTIDNIPALVHTLSEPMVVDLLTHGGTSSSEVTILIVHS